MAALLGGCSGGAPAPQDPSPEPSSAPEPPAAPERPAAPQAPAASAPTADWADTQGWHRIASLPEIQRRPQAIAATRRGETIAVLGPRGRRVTLVSRAGAPSHVMLPVDVVGEDLAIDESEQAAALVVSCPRQAVLLRVALAAGDAQELGRDPLVAGRALLETTPDGGVEVLDGLLRPDPAEPAVRGLAGASGRRYRAVRRDALAGIVGSGEGGRRMAMLARIPHATAVQVVGMDPADPSNPDGLDAGWLAAWTGEDATRRLHFVRFDADGRVLQTTPAPGSSPPPEGFDLRAAVLGARDLVLALPGDGGLDLWRYVGGADGQRLSIELGPSAESPPTDRGKPTAP